tara:strand:+ start:296 stop:553 length:258 start_codon:yes stop_codon:yes gene_type:complete
MSEPYTGSYKEDTRVLFFDKSVEPTLTERSINYNKDGNEVTITIPDNGETIGEALTDLGITDLEDNYLYSHYNVDANVPENLQSV